MTYIKINYLRFTSYYNSNKIYLILIHEDLIKHTDPIKSINNEFIWINEIYFIKKNDYLFIDIYEKNNLKKDKLLCTIQINLKYDLFNYNNLTISYEIVEIINKKAFNKNDIDLYDKLKKENKELKKENLKLKTINDNLLKDKHRLLDIIKYNNKI